MALQNLYRYRPARRVIADDDVLPFPGVALEEPTDWNKGSQSVWWLSRPFCDDEAAAFASLGVEQEEGPPRWTAGRMDPSPFRQLFSDEESLAGIAVSSPLKAVIGWVGATPAYNGTLHVDTK